MKTRVAIPTADGSPTPRRSTVRRLLLLYGIVLALVALAAGEIVWPASHVTLMSSRTDGLTSAIDVVDHGGPPLLASRKPYADPWRTTPGQSYLAAGFTDDPGIYVYLPEAGRVLGVHDPLVLLKWFTLGSFALLAGFYPLLFFELFGSIAAGVVSPLLLGAFSFLGNSDIYWVPGWCALFCLPVLMLVAARRWSGRSVAICVGIAVVASYASSIRSQAGVGVAIAAIALVLLRERTWRRRAGAAALVAVAYLAIQPGLMRGIETYRDHVIASYIRTHPGWASVSNSGHPFWHSAYIGLGYLPNRWGIVWKDASAEAAVRRVDPTAPFLSSRYSSILEHRYFTILREDPGFVIRTYATKAAVEANQALRRFLPGLLLLPALLLFGRHRKLLQRSALLVVPTLVIQFVPPVLTFPNVYGVGFLSAVGLLALLAGCELVALLEAAVTAHRRGGAALPDRAAALAAFRQPRAWLAAAAILLLLIGAVALHSRNLVLRPGSAVAGPPIAHA
jgi:hypothetical protein